MPSSDLIAIPSTQRSVGEIAPLLCSGGTALAGVRAAGLYSGDWLCVTGAAGGVGSLALQYGKHSGYKVVAVDSEKKRHHCETLGAKFVAYEDAKNIVRRVMEITGGGAKGTVVCSANPASYSSYSQAIEYSAIGATVVSIGPSTIHLHTGQLIQKGIKLVAQRNGTKKDITDALALGNQGIVPTVQVVPLESLDVGLDKLKSGQVVGRQVIVFT
ncbi:alcohol dehydrogenase [Diaporthe australafricana]|uniref:Alcohol dehydrogenase n=1 Tax=Diaporthe australafricana TaxID=127596 RepID=A0ABR3VUZ0_9PEZI